MSPLTFFFFDPMRSIHIPATHPQQKFSHLHLTNFSADQVPSWKPEVHDVCHDTSETQRQGSFLMVIVWDDPGAWFTNSLGKMRRTHPISGIARSVPQVNRQIWHCCEFGRQVWVANRFILVSDELESCRSIGARCMQGVDFYSFYFLFLFTIYSRQQALTSTVSGRGVG